MHLFGCEIGCEQQAMQNYIKEIADYRSHWLYHLYRFVEKGKSIIVKSVVAGFRKTMNALLRQVNARIPEPIFSGVKIVWCGLHPAKILYLLDSAIVDDIHNSRGDIQNAESMYGHFLGLYHLRCFEKEFGSLEYVMNASASKAKEDEALFGSAGDDDDFQIVDVDDDDNDDEEEEEEEDLDE